MLLSRSYQGRALDVDCPFMEENAKRNEKFNILLIKRVNKYCLLLTYIFTNLLYLVRHTLIFITAKRREGKNMGHA